MQIHRKRITFLMILFVLCILIAVYCGVQYFDEQQNCCGDHDAQYLSTSGYTRELSLKRFDEESILHAYGDPTSRTRWVDTKHNDRTLILDRYPTFDARYVYTDWYEGEPYNELIQVVIKSDSLRFCKKKIGIGSIIEEVKKAYIKDQKIDEDELAYCSIDYPNVDEGYYGDRWCFILFCFGEDDTVISMAMQPPGFWVW